MQTPPDQVVDAFAHSADMLLQGLRVTQGDDPERGKLHGQGSKRIVVTVLHAVVPPLCEEPSCNQRTTDNPSNVSVSARHSGGVGSNNRESGLSVIRRWHFREGLSDREVPRHTKLSLNMISKYLTSGEMGPHYVRRASKSKSNLCAEQLQT